MKKIYSLIFTFVFTAGLVIGQEPGMPLKNAVKNYLIGLNHDNPGVVESTITNVMLLKLYHPDNDFSKIFKRLDDLSINAAEKIVRLKAFIAANYIKHPERFNWIEKGDYEDAVAFFDLYSAKLNEMYRGIEKRNELTTVE